MSAPARRPVATTPSWRCGDCDTVNPDGLGACSACGAPATRGRALVDTGTDIGATTVVTRSPGGEPAHQPVIPAPSARPVPDGERPGGMQPAARQGKNFGIAAAVLCFVPYVGVILGIGLGVTAIVLSSNGLSRSPNPSPSRSAATVGLVLGIASIVFKLIPGTSHL